MKHTFQRLVDAEIEDIKIVAQSPDNSNASSAQIENDAGFSGQTSGWIAADFNNTLQCAVDAEMEIMKLLAVSQDESNASSAQAQCESERAQSVGMEALFDDPFQMAQESVFLRYKDGCRGQNLLQTTNNRFGKFKTLLEAPWKRFGNVL